MNNTNNTTDLPNDLITRLKEIKGDIVTWPAQASLYFNKYFNGKLKSRSWFVITKFFSNKFCTNFSVSRLQGLTTNKRVFKYVNGEGGINFDKLCKSIKKGKWERYSEEYFRREKKNYVHHSRSSNFNNNRHQNKKLNSSKVNSFEKIAKLCQCCQLAYQELFTKKIIDKIKSSNTTKLQEKIKSLERIEKKLCNLIDTNQVLSQDDIPEDLADTYWYIAGLTDKINETNSRDYKRRGFTQHNFMYETNHACFHRRFNIAINTALEFFSDDPEISSTQIDPIELGTKNYNLLPLE
ncbi:MAG: hypothetical protein MHPSP_002468 [Paramarteilia canceri]